MNLTEKEINIIYEALLYYLEEAEITNEIDSYGYKVNKLLEKLEN